MKKLITTVIIISVIIIAIIIVIHRVNWGRLGIDILKRATGYIIIYEKIDGDLLRGYTIQNYVIKLSPIDSITGKKAQISYRFSPLNFRIPTIFQLYLTEPVINLKQKKGGPGEGKLSIPKINLSIRINIKNGRVIYENYKRYEVEGISGLVFIDFLGKNIYLSTMNLSLAIPEVPLNIYSANMLLSISPERFEAKSYQIKGKGINFQGSGFYSPEEKNLYLKIKSGEFNLNEMGIYKGNIALKGEVHLVNGKVIPQVQGLASGIDFVDRVNFESNILGDTAVINLFNGEALSGNFSAQIKMLNLKDYVIETNFRNIDVSRFLKLEKSIILNGRIGYKNKIFSGIINSPVENGLAIDTLYISGFHKDGQIFVDTININEDDLNIFAAGKLYPDYDIGISINTLDLKRFEIFYPMTGIVKGDIHLKGKINEFKKTNFNLDIKINDFTINDFYSGYSSIKLENFVWMKNITKLLIETESMKYKNFQLDRLNFSADGKEFGLTASRNSDTLFTWGELSIEGRGLIDSFMAVYNKKKIYNLEPIYFDIFNKAISRVHLRLAGGEFLLTIKEKKLIISDVDLGELAEFFGLKEQIKGKITLSLEKNILSAVVQDIFYRGLNNGKLILKGEYLKDRINIINLDIKDDNNQSVNADGHLSLNNSKIHFKFIDVRPWIFPFLNSFMDNPDGLINGELVFEGNLKDFKIEGDAEINNAKFGIKAISSKFDSGYAYVKLSGNQIIFETVKAQILSGFSAFSELRSWVTGGGVVKLEPKFRVRNLRFDFSFRDAPLQYQNYAYGVGSGNFSISIKEEIPSYDGSINIKEGIIPIEFGTYFEPATEEQKQEWQMNLKLSGDRNIWLRNRDADIEFGGEVYITKEINTPLFVTGSLETKRGNYYWLTHILKITSGKISFIPQEVIDPELDFWAEMDTKERDPETNQEIKIILHCTGNISEPIFEFFSDPPRYSEQDILTYMNLNIPWREIESMKQGEYVGRILPRSILAWLESDISRRLRAYTGLDYFRIEAPIFEPEEKTKVTVGKYVSRNLFVTYTYDITSYSNEFNVEYFIDDRNEILIKRDDTGEYSLQYQYRIRF